jgi:hypothetical protein
MPFEVERWKAPNQGVMYQWLRAVFDSLSAFLFGQFTELDEGTRRLGCMARRSAAQVIGNAAQTTITYDVVDEDDDSILNAGTGVVTVPSDGIYAFSFTSGTANWDGASTRTFLILTSTATGFPSAGFYYETLGVAAADGRGSVSGVFRFAAGNTFQANVFQQSGGNQNFTGGSLNFWRISE